MTAAAYGPAASTMRSANRSTPATSAEKPARQGGRVGVEAEAQDASRRRPSAPRAARGRSRSRGGRAARARRPALTRRGRGRRRQLIGAGRTSRAATRRRARTPRSGRSMSLTVQSGRCPSSRTSSRSTIWPWMWRNAIASPTGDQTGAQDAPSLVSRRSSRPLDASRMTTSLPKLLVLVAAMYRPSGENDGLEVARPGQRRDALPWPRPSGRSPARPARPSRPLRT